MLGNTRMNYSPSLHLRCSFYIWQSCQIFFSFASFRAEGGHCPSRAVDLYFAYSSHLPSCRPAEADRFSMMLISLHPTTSQVMDLSSQHIFEERRSYYLFSRFGDGRRWKKWSTGFAVQFEIIPIFLKNLEFCRINTGTRSSGLKYHWEHWTWLQSRLQGVKLGIPKKDDHTVSGCPHATRLHWVSQCI